MKNRRRTRRAKGRAGGGARTLRKLREIKRDGALAERNGTEGTGLSATLTIHQTTREPPSDESCRSSPLFVLLESVKRTSLDESAFAFERVSRGLINATPSTRIESRLD